jgi:hypothetical protein
MDSTLFWVAVSLCMVGLVWWTTSRRHKDKRRREFIQSYPFPAALAQKLRQKHPTLSEAQTVLVLEGLRQFFLICLRARVVSQGRSIGMPSRIVDDVWHEFILMTREYLSFCERAFGGTLHHTPAALSNEPTERGILRTYHQLQATGPKLPAWSTLGGIPLLFALDKALGVEGGHHYDAEAMAALERKRSEWLLHGDGGVDGGGHLDAEDREPHEGGDEDAGSGGDGDSGGGDSGGDGGGGDSGGGCGGGGD